MPRGAMLSSAERERFFPRVARLVRELEAIPLRQTKKEIETIEEKKKPKAPMEPDIWS